MTTTPREGIQERRFLSVPDPKFQREFVGLILFVALLSSAIMLIGTYFMVQKVSSFAADIGGSVGAGLESEFAGNIHLIWTLMIGATLVNGLCIGIFAFAFSKRASGIVRRVTNDLNRFADGQPVAVIRPRDGDFFLDLVAATNRILEKKEPRA